MDYYTFLSSLLPDDLSIIKSFLDELYANINLSKHSNHDIIQREHKKIFVCPICGSLHIVRNGKTPNGAQKYICRDCKKSFSDTTNTIVYHSKKHYTSWKTFIKCELYNMTLEDTAYEVKISKTCAFNWRHKLQKALTEFIENRELSKEIQMDSLYFDINFKGTKPKNMPRKSKKRPFSNFKGISREKACVISAIDEDDNILMKVAGAGKETIEYYHGFDSHLRKPTKLVGDQFWGFTTLAKNWNCELEQIPTTEYVNDKGNSLATINQLHSELRGYLHKYRGVSIRHLQGYLNMFTMIKYLKYHFNHKEREKQAYINSIPSNIILFNKDICTQPLPINLNFVFGLNA